MRVVGSRKERPISFSASAELLAEGCRFNDEIHKLRTGHSTGIRKGVYFYKTHQEANEHQDSCLAESIAKHKLEN